mmetsp:Transcript_6858/g.20851  ORF Transcript_6858/g.20851 Transcript_6858/m.20851 type:complete len:280 (-) Transcript_6858:995-1834(-)|eukprot:CAMPEP_0198725762 /NCGR_PEP_ID=MMETSP1475-20131203/3008_1 /TAXON_ID= ORGANISM="Unidentified sp., Strain CCMP1999" /NCGR_SAMPLE_ID=MMETSP1475 /ASSEMBLY_ACC=CAM_ASM_001111 /LENGTH=279 /DNA_ID=CAMNT_0044487591 /DNA_START=467 /DNA_END=1306 /DNA_ORIENTATION=+
MLGDIGTGLGLSHEAWSPSRQRRRSAGMGKKRRRSTGDEERPQKAEETAAVKQRRPLSKLQAAMQKKLEGGQFRQLNEQMYGTTGSEAFEMMKRNPSLFDVYHRGYNEQVKKWPRNPLDDIIAFLRKQSHQAVVADFGCGEARLSLEAPQQVVHSFDLVAANDRVTACNMKQTKLPKKSVDFAVFCLSLMGTDYPLFLTEAKRVLKPSGRLIIAEVSSRITARDQFVGGIERMGFALQKERTLSDFFVIWFFRRTPSSSEVVATDAKLPPLKASVYKKR